jgi:putative membrane protein
VTTPDPATDLRVYFAAERTLLAWIRTGITVMAFGFVIARFGLFLRFMEHQVASGAPPAGAHSLSPILGAGMVWLGVFATTGGVLQYQAFCRRLAGSERPPRLTVLFGLLVAWALALTGLLLGVALLR